MGSSDFTWQPGDEPLVPPSKIVARTRSALQKRKSGPLLVHSFEFMDHAPLQSVFRNDEMREASSDRRWAMTTYYFNLKGHHGRYVDPHGTELPDLAQAKEHARQVALELMHRRESKTRSWRLEVCDARRTPIFELLFATVDPRLTELPPTLRTTVEELSARTGGMVDAIVDIRNTLHQLKGSLARSNREPYLAVLDGTIL